MNPTDYKKFLTAYRLMQSKKKNASQRTKVFHIWNELSEKGYIRSTFYLGVCYDFGIGTEKDVKKAYNLYLLAARDNHETAQYNLYQILLSGDGIKRNLRGAWYWLRKSVQNGCVDAYRNLGYHYHEGDIIKKSYKKAIYFYKLAAKKGDVKAQWNLGLCYMEGDGANKAKRWAKYWFNKAMKGGHKEATKILRKEEFR